MPYKGVWGTLSGEGRADAEIAVQPLAQLPVLASISPDGGHVMLLGGALRETLDDVQAAVQFLDVASGHLTDARTASTSPWLTPLWSASTPMTWDTAGTVTEWDPVDGVEVERQWSRINTSLVGLSGDEAVVLSDAMSAVLRLSSDGELVAPAVPLASLEQGAGLAFAQLSLRPVPTADDGRLAVAFAGPATEVSVADGSLRPSVSWPYLFERLPASDRLVLLDPRDLEDTTVVELGFDGTAAAIDPTGRRVAVTGSTGEVGVVDVASGRFVATPAVGHEGRGRSVAWTADGALVASGGDDGRVALWDGETAAPLGSVPVAPPGTIPYVAAGPSTSVLVATTAGEVHSLDTRLESWTATACALAGRPLSEAEWRSVAGARPRPDACAGG